MKETLSQKLKINECKCINDLVLFPISEISKAKLFNVIHESDCLFNIEVNKKVDIDIDFHKELNDIKQTTELLKTLESNVKERFSKVINETNPDLIKIFYCSWYYSKCSSKAIKENIFSNHSLNYNRQMKHGNYVYNENGIKPDGNVIEKIIFHAKDKISEDFDKTLLSLNGLNLNTGDNYLNQEKFLNEIDTSITNFNDIEKSYFLKYCIRHLNEDCNIKSPRTDWGTIEGDRSMMKIRLTGLDTIKKLEERIIIPINDDWSYDTTNTEHEQQDENNLTQSKIEDFLFDFKNKLSEHDYNFLVSALIKYFKDGIFPKPSKPIQVNGRINKKAFGWALNRLFESEGRGIEKELLLFAKESISSFKHVTFDENNYLNSNLYKYFTTKTK